jgi:hypothetical protein
MQTLEFHRSFLVFELDLDLKDAKTVADTRQNTHNRPRIQIDCRCQITDPAGKTTEYFLGESCKQERVGVTREVGVFLQPNADFRPVLSTEYAMFFRSWEKNDRGVMLEPASLGPQPERQVVKADVAFYSHGLKLSYAEGTILSTPEEIIEATDAGAPLVARTEYQVAGYDVLLEYPILTMNVSEKHVSYQTDTGPVLFPELGQPHENIPASFWLAFSAFNAPDWIEFIVQKPTSVGENISVNHYSEIVQIDGCKNSVIKLA